MPIVSVGAVVAGEGQYVVVITLERDGALGKLVAVKE